MVNHLTIACIFSMQMTLISLLHAEQLHDPTMPPASLGLVQADAMQMEKSKPILQSVAIGTTHKAALISGQTVLLGQQFEGLTLIKLTATEAVLQGKDKHLEVLKMEYPVQKKAISGLIKPAINAKRHAAWHAENEMK
jgi:MSHA biogenesis protein MshK